MNTKLILNFLKKLSENNNREWFEANKNECNEAKNEFLNLTEKFINSISDFDKSVIGLEAKSCIFRLNRDIRFSKDKTPYKNWFGAYVIQGGKKNMKAGYYIHIEPQNSLIGAGLHLPSNEWLTLVREEISENGNELLKLINEPKFKSIFGNFLGEKLKKAPRNFSPDDKFIELIKMKSFDIVYNYADNFVENSEKFIKDAIQKFEIIKPINDFFNGVLAGK
jgi:uncharacterized protein (TIGR02453 family)